MYKIFVEKKETFATEKKEIFGEIKNYLGIKSLDNIRIVNGYNIHGINEEEIEKSSFPIFVDKETDNYYKDLDFLDTDNYISFSILKGQYCQRSDSAEQLLKTQNIGSNPIVESFTIFLLYGNISDSDVNTIKNYYINPTEKIEYDIYSKNKLTNIEQKQFKETIINDFITMNEDGLKKLQKEYEISLTIENLHFCQDYYKEENKNPTVTELKILDTYWSDHCRHSTFLTEITDVTIEDTSLNKSVKEAYELYKSTRDYVYEGKDRVDCLMDMATIEMKNLKKQGKLSDLEETDEINACSIETKIDIDGKMEDYLLMFKNETHNHPTEIEPFGGASTCLGGGIRDPLSGRSYVFGAIRVSGSGDPREKYNHTLENKLPQRKITTEAANGYSSYANEIGLASPHLLEFYHEGFKAKRLECGALVSAAPKKNVLRESSEPGDIILLLGGKTGRDGCGGATGSSRVQGEKASEENSAEVQKGNPIVQRGIVRLFRNENATKLIKKCNDFGAGGVSVAIGELADGIYVNLDNIKTKYAGLTGTELAISESQERMAVVLAKENVEDFLVYASKEDVEATEVAHVTDNNRMILVFEGEEIANISRTFLDTGGVRKKQGAIVKSPKNNKINVEYDNAIEKLKNNLKELNIASKKDLASQFDYTVGSSTVLAPYGGKYKLTEEQGLAMRIPVLEGKTNDGVLMTVGYNPDYCDVSPFHSAAYAVIESITKIVAMGGDYKSIRLSFQEYFESLGENKESWGKPLASLMGAFFVQSKLGVPSVGGKDSMSGTYQKIKVPPSLISFAINQVDIRNIVSKSFKKHDCKVILLYTPKNVDNIPCFDTLKENLDKVSNLSKQGRILSSSVVGAGGILTEIAKMTFGNKVGFKFNQDFNMNLFEPMYENLILEIVDENDFAGLNYKVIGKTQIDKNIEINSEIIDIDSLIKIYEKPLKEVFGYEPEVTKINKEILTIQVKDLELKNKKDNYKNVLIPVFPGTTDEYANEKYFSESGFNVSTLLFKISNGENIKESFLQLEKSINNCDILVLPSGMTAGNEPDGAAKLITLILKSENIKNAVNKFIDNGGLILGFGEGFKALIDTGLIDSGKISSDRISTLSLNKNPNNKFHSDLLRVKIAQNVMPWHNGTSDLCEYIPVATSYGSLFMNEEDYLKYKDNGQIITQFIDDNDNASLNPSFNPYDCSYAVESMVSENEQIYGRIGSPERMDSGLFINVSENINRSSIFKNLLK